MGNWIASLMEMLVGKKEKRILMLGLDAAGKTTILYHFKLGEVVHTIPTIGFNVEEVQFKNINFTVFDVGGQAKLRPLWKHYYAGVDALIYVVDSSDEERLAMACEELHGIMGDGDFPHSASLLVYANKQDMPHALDVKELAEQLRLKKLRGHDWFIQPSCATRGEGVVEGMEWLSTNLSNKKSK